MTAGCHTSGKQWAVLACLVLLQVGCNGGAEPATDDDGGIVFEDGGDRAADCTAIRAHAGWMLCASSPIACEGVFEDGAGCAALCAAVELPCVAVYEDLPGQCAPNPELPPLSCDSPSGHQSDYCICGVCKPDCGGKECGDDGCGGICGSCNSGESCVAGSCTPTGSHESLLYELTGFGQTTTGGLGGELITVTSLSDSGAGTLRQALTMSGPKWIRFAVSGTISLSSPIQASSHKTLDGRGADITITGWGIYIQNGAENVILNNLKFINGTDDAIRLYNGGGRVWVHHCDISKWSDGAFDATESTTEVTVSYTHIYDHDKTMLVGASSDTGDGINMRWTAHHNWYDRCVQRLPFIRFGKAHSFNNLFNWVSGTAMSCRLAPAQLFSENDIFEPLTGVDHKVITGDGAVKFSGVLEKPYSATLLLTENAPETVFDPHDYYDYIPDVADAALESAIEAQAGWQDLPWPD